MKPHIIEHLITPTGKTYRHVSRIGFTGQTVTEWQARERRNVLFVRFNRWRPVTAEERREVEDLRAKERNNEEGRPGRRVESVADPRGKFRDYGAYEAFREILLTGQDVNREFAGKRLTDVATMLVDDQPGRNGPARDLFLFFDDGTILSIYGEFVTYEIGNTIKRRD